MTDIFAEAMQKTGTRNIDILGKKYSITILKASQGLEVGTRLIKTVAPAIGIFFDNREATKGLQSEDGEVVFLDEQTIFTDLAVALVTQLDNLDLIGTIKGLLASLHCNSQPVVFDDHFAGNLGELAAVVEFALKENFADFFTSYLKAKGLEIHTLGEMFNPTPTPASTLESEEKSDDL